MRILRLATQGSSESPTLGRFMRLPIPFTKEPVTIHYASLEKEEPIEALECRGSDVLPESLWVGTLKLLSAEVVMSCQNHCVGMACLDSRPHRQ